MSASSTYKTFLMRKVSTTYSKLLDITEFPNMGGDPEMLETTTLSDFMQTFVLGVQSNEGLRFSANYSPTDYQTLKDITGEQDFAVWFGGTTNTAGVATPTGDLGKFSFKGELSVYVNGAGVNAVRSMSITIAPTTAIAFEIPTQPVSN